MEQTIVQKVNFPELILKTKYKQILANASLNASLIAYNKYAKEIISNVDELRAKKQQKCTCYGDIQFYLFDVDEDKVWAQESKVLSNIQKGIKYNHCKDCEACHELYNANMPYQCFIDCADYEWDLQIKELLDEKFGLNFDYYYHAWGPLNYKLRNYLK